MATIKTVPYTRDSPQMEKVSITKALERFDFAAEFLRDLQGGMTIERSDDVSPT